MEPDRTPPPQSIAVTIEVVAWVTWFVGGDGTRRVLIPESALPDTTLRDVLRRLSDRYPALQDALWTPDRSELAEHIEVLVNDAVLGVTHSLESPVREGDRITLLAQYVGG